MRRIAPLALAGAAALALPAAATLGNPRPLRVAFVTDVITAPGPHTLRGDALRGFLRAVKEFHLQGRVVQYNPTQGQAPTLTALGRERYDLVIAGVFNSDADFIAFPRIAARFPRTAYVAPGLEYRYLKGRPKNVQGWEERVEEPAFLAGYLAALVERGRPGRDVIGSVGGYPVVNVDNFIAGYEAGARKAEPGITTLRRYARSFDDPAKCKAVTLGEIARGAGVVFDVAGLCGPGTLTAAREKGVWGIGVDTDQSFRGSHILTSVVYRGAIESYETVRALVRGRLKTGGDQVWDLRNGGVGLGRISPRVPRPLVARVERIRRQIVAGRIRVPSTLRGR